MKLSKVLFSGAAAVVAMASPPEPAYLTKRPPLDVVEPSLAEIVAAQATTKPISLTSNVKGVGFDRIIQIWLENTNFNIAARDPSMQWLASKGILLTNYFAVTHPSQPNYAASVAGDHFGMENDDFNYFPPNISTVVDLLDTKGISWGEYQEGIPYAGFLGFNYSNQKTYANNYVRKHNPLIMFDSVAKNTSRALQIKGFDTFREDLKNKKLPQWSFITPNMTNDAHDTNITFAASWARRFLEPLMNNSYFMDNTLVILTFDECEVYPTPNKIYTVLLGGAIPQSLHGTTDNTFYNHYSTLSTVSVNWGLPSLGRWDCDANVFEIVANKTEYKNADVKLDYLYFNTSYPGPLSDKMYTPGWWPEPATGAKCAAGLGVLPSVVKTWGNAAGTYNYTNVYPYDEVSGSNTGGVPTVGVKDVGYNLSGSGSPTEPKKNGAGVMRLDFVAGLASIGLLAAFLWGV